MKQQINLFQPTLRDPEPVFGARAMLRTVCTVLVGLAAVYGYALVQVNGLEREAKDLSAARTSAEHRFGELQAQLPKREQNLALVARVEALNEELAQTRRLVAVLNQGAFGNTAGLSPYLAGLARQHVSGTWLTHVDIAAGGTQIGVEGRAQAPELVPMYVQKLAGEHAFEGKVFSHLELDRAPEDTAIAFSLATSGIDLAEESMEKRREH